MTGHPLLSRHAQADLDAIWTHSIKHWGVDQAEGSICHLARDIERVTAQASAGTACAWIRTGYYKYRSGSHVLFYRRSDAGIEIIRILHARMDFPRHL